MLCSAHKPAPLPGALGEMLVIDANELSLFVLFLLGFISPKILLLGVPIVVQW